MGSYLEITFKATVRECRGGSLTHTLQTRHWRRRQSSGQTTSDHWKAASRLRNRLMSDLSSQYLNTIAPWMLLSTILSMEVKVEKKNLVVLPIITLYTPTFTATAGSVICNAIVEHHSNIWNGCKNKEKRHIQDLYSNYITY